MQDGTAVEQSDGAPRLQRGEEEMRVPSATL